MADQVTESKFVELLCELMSKHPDFDNIRTPPVKRWKETFLNPDILCERAGAETLIEVKGVTPFTSHRIGEVLFQLGRYAEAWPDAEIVAAIPGRLSERYQLILRESGVDVWDLSTVEALFGHYSGDPGDQEIRRAFGLDSPDKSNEPESLESELQSLKVGRPDWLSYQKLCARIFEYLFSPPLERPIFERADASGVNRRDFILPNYAESGFWRFLRDAYGAFYVVVDSKNHKSQVKKNSVLQVANYLKEAGSGLFALVCSRNGFDRSAAHCQREQWLLHRKLILDLEDDDILQMLINKREGGQPEAVIQQKIEDFRLAL